MNTPVPAWEVPVYGGQFWLSRTAEFDLRRDTYMIAGSGHQRVFSVASADLVVVRTSHLRGNEGALPSINAMLPAVMAAISAR